MKEIINKIKNDKILFWGFSISLFLIIFNLFYLFLYYQKLPPLIPLFNQLPWGEPRLAELHLIFIPALISFLILIINFIISMNYYSRIPLIARIFCITSSLVSFLAVLFIIRTIQLII